MNMKKAIAILLMIKFIAELLVKIMGYVIATVSIVFEEYQNFKNEKKNVLDKFNIKKEDDRKEEKKKKEDNDEYDRWA